MTPDHSLAGKRRSVALALAGLAAINLAYYKLDPHAYQATRVVQTADLFDSPPNRDGSVARLPGFSYRLARPMSDGVYERYFGNVPHTGDALEDALAVAKRVRGLYVHGAGGEIEPWLPDEGIAEATRHPVLCDIYACTQVAALEHMGHISRVIYLSGHVAPEIYDFARRAWLYVDPNGGIYVSSPEGSVLSLAQIGDRVRRGQPFVVHRIDNSTDDPQYVLDGMGRGSIYEHYLEYQDGPGMQYRRKSLFQIGHVARLVVYRPPDAPFRPSWISGVLAVNALAIGALASVFLFRRSRQGPRAGVVKDAPAV